MRSRLAPEKPAPPAGEDEDAWSVSTFNTRIVQALRAKLPGRLRVRGEIAGWQRAASGHRYFTLKDNDASVSAKMWTSKARSLSFEPSNGQEVIVTGSVDYWTVRGQLSISCDRIEPVGAGALEAAYRKLVERLRNEGLFEPARKLPIPPYPATLAIVSSPSAAGYQDVLKVLGRFAFLRRLLLPARVQGDGAADELRSAIELLGRRHDEIGGIDLILPRARRWIDGRFVVLQRRGPRPRHRRLSDSDHRRGRP